MDAKTIQVLAEATAKAAAAEIAKQLTKEVADQFEKGRHELKSEISQEIRGYFGSRLSPDEHLIAHSRIDRFLAFHDKVMAHFWGKVVMALITVAMLGIGLMWFVGSKLFGH